MWLMMRFETLFVLLSIAWCAYIVRRLPSDIAELVRLFRAWRRSRAAPCSDELWVEERRVADRARNSREFWSSVVVQVLFFWPVTAVLLLAVVIPTMSGAVSSILRSIN